MLRQFRPKWLIEIREKVFLEKLRRILRLNYEHAYCQKIYSRRKNDVEKALYQEVASYLKYLYDDRSNQIRPYDFKKYYIKNEIKKEIDSILTFYPMPYFYKFLERVRWLYYKIISVFLIFS